MNRDGINHPTASELPRLKACPGSRALCRGIASIDSPASLAGTHIHAALASRTEGNEPDEESAAWKALSDDEQETTRILAAIEAKAIAPFIAEHGAPDEIARERRFYIYKGIEAVFSAQLDVTYNWRSGRAVIFDYKSGFGDVAESADNVQLLAQVACLAHGIGYDMIAAGIISGKGVPDLVGYSTAEQELAEREVLRLIAETEKPDAPLKTGDHCTYCKAKLICPALNSEVTALAKVTDAEGALTLTDSLTLAGLLERIGPVERLIDAAKEEAKRRIQSGVEVPGWTLEPGASRRIVTDPQKALEALSPLGVTPEAMLAAVTVKIGELETITRKASGLKGVKAKSAFEEALENAGCLARKENAPSLVRAKLIAEEAA